MMQLCFSEIGGHLARPYSVDWTPADWERLYVTSEDSGRIVQLDIATGQVVGSTPQMANHLMVHPSPCVVSQDGWDRGLHYMHIAMTMANAGIPILPKITSFTVPVNYSSCEHELKLLVGPESEIEGACALALDHCGADLH